MCVVFYTAFSFCLKREMKVTVEEHWKPLLPSVAAT